MLARILTPPLDPKTIESLRAGDEVLLTGAIYSARDAAHKRLCDLITAKKPLPIDLSGQILYFVGPTPAKPGNVLISEISEPHGLRAKTDMRVLVTIAPPI